MTRSELESKFRQDNSSRIEFVRIYKWYGGAETADIVYKTKRVRTVPIKDMPKTAVRFVRESTRQENQHDKIFNRDEVLYF